ncbi:MAG: sigma-70 family RNA polymerase sigma factor [Gammaproteobacteria bacterium]|nr:sigma-70 family RNA polymerase sigma factor [Gammaproteobacteria bacterium]
MPNEVALIEAARKGSTTAFTDLVGNYREGLLRFLLTRSSSFADAEDALQDTLINAYRYLHSYDPRWRFSTWLYRIAINNAIKLKTIDTVEITDLHDEESDPLAHCIKAADRENLWQCARRNLNDEVYTAMWLRYVEDMSVNDIGAVLNRSVSWTKVNLLRGRKTLESELNKDATDTKSKAYG